jgi:hypothetical protein
MLIAHDVASNQDGVVANSCTRSNAIARAEQAYYGAIADHGVDSAEALAALKFLQWHRRHPITNQVSLRDKE